MLVVSSRIAGALLTGSVRTEYLRTAELQRLADKIRLSIHVSHFPPGTGTSKWNKIEHRLFSFISINWRGRPLRTYETVVNLMARRPV